MQLHDEYITQVRSPVRQWIESFNRHDVEAIVALYSDDAELFDSGMRHPRRGRREIERWFCERFRSMPSIRYTLTGHIFMEEKQAAVTWTTSGRGLRLAGLPLIAHPYQVDGVSVFNLRDGLIERQRGYYDHLGALEQLLPPLRVFSLLRL
jgi:steroid delta-isomerase-like uncharacterized protein